MGLRGGKIDSRGRRIGDASLAKSHGDMSDSSVKAVTH
jgi:hypothetical protein